jgi:hypothetical protein
VHLCGENEEVCSGIVQVRRDLRVWSRIELTETETSNSDPKHPSPQQSGLRAALSLAQSRESGRSREPLSVFDRRTPLRWPPRTVGALSRK